MELLGNRDIDTIYAWENHVGRYQHLYEDRVDFWKLMKANNPQSLAIGDVPDSAYTGLNENQRVVFNLFVGHYLEVLEGREPEPILLQVDGQGGTGKSHVIRTVSAWLERLAAGKGYELLVVRAAPTGVAANNINGVTLHSLFRLLINKKEIDLFNNLKPSAYNATYITIDILLSIKSL